MSTPTKDGAAIYRHAAKFTEQSAVDTAKAASGACCLKHMKSEHYRLVIACLDAERPPGLGVDQAQPVRVMTFEGYDKSDMTVMLPRGMEVNVAPRAFYWREVKSAFTETRERMKTVGHQLQEFYVLKGGAPIARSRLIETDGPHEYAWLSCMVVEAFGNGHRIAFDMPPEAAKAALQVEGVGAFVDITTATKH